MNHTASQSFKKLLLMSLVVFAGHAFGQATQGTQADGKQNAQQQLSPTKEGAGIIVDKKDAKPNLSVNPTSTAASGNAKRDAAAAKPAPVTNPGKPAATVSSKPAKPVTAAPISQLEQVNRDIADIEAKLKKDGISATTKSALENRLVDLKKEQKRLSVPEKK
jgi:hypothetical protein